MGKLLKKDVEKWNSECKNDFKFDVEYYIFHNEKTVEKIIELDKEHYLKTHIMYYDKRENFKWIGYYINVNISKWYHKEGENFASSNGLGISLALNDIIYKKRSFKELQKATELINTELIMSIYNKDIAGEKVLENGRIL